MEDKTYKIISKKGEKWWQYGTIKKSPKGNLQLSMKVTQELKDLVNNGGEWLNLLVKEDDGGNYKSKPPAQAQPLDDAIPF